MFVVEFWAGPDRSCPHRCCDPKAPAGSCGATVASIKQEDAELFEDMLVGLLGGEAGTLADAIAAIECGSSSDSGDEEVAAEPRGASARGVT